MTDTCICITGASSGLGKALALGLAAPGRHLILAGRDMNRLDEVRRAATDSGAMVTCVCGDLCQEQELHCLEAVIQEMRPDLLFLNAGMGRYGRFVETPLEPSEAIVTLNVLAVVRLVKRWSDAMLAAHKSGKVVFIASTAAFLPLPGQGVYGASKAFIVSFAEALRFELRSSGLEVLTICPGYFKTRFQQRAAGKAAQEVDESEAKKMAQKIIKRLKKTGVYVPFPWRWLLLLRYLLPSQLRNWIVEKRMVSHQVVK